ncbi:MAG: hypothetical protein J6X61_03640 [Clostridia bacterium]|nr:hypothetical protein [Clostridia bacterium]
MDNQVYPAPVPDTSAANEEAGGVLKTGILAAALSVTGIPGIILSIIGIKQSKAWAKKHGSYTAKARVGRYLSIAALPSSIVCLFYWLICIGFTLFWFWLVLHTNDLPKPLSLDHLPEFVGMLM